MNPFLSLARSVRPRPAGRFGLLVLALMTLILASPRTVPGEDAFLTGVRQLTFEGRRAGEGYFRADGKALVFQSEREPRNPFFQIYTMDLETGDVLRVSPGIGKTTCAWFHPDGRRVLFASTHDDPDAVAKQKAELKAREEGRERRYSWDYDEYFDIYLYDTRKKTSTNLTGVRGYDAEGSISPDGKWVVFASNRRAYDGSMTEAEKVRFEHDPAVMLDLYRMKIDGSRVERLTDVLGYDGGPFFSPDGKRICFRRFGLDGATAEIMTINADGSDAKRLTKMGALSWAPYYHPSGKYLIFATNEHGFANFELYLIDVEGRSKPVRVTDTAGFDGLPVFSPDGKQLAWTSNRTPDKTSQIFIGEWDHEAALKRLGLSTAVSVDTSAAEQAAADGAQLTDATIDGKDILRHVDYLCREELGGRSTGTKGERLATAYVAAYFDHLGLEPAGDNGSYFQDFSFTAGVSLGDHNELKWGERTYRVDRDWRPLAFSATGKVSSAPLVFAGYGIVAPGEGDDGGYDSYVHLDVKGKWVVILRYVPEDVTDAERQTLHRYATLRYKTMVARDKGAAGLIVVSGPRTKVKQELVPLKFDGSMGASSLPVISITNEVAAQWFSAAGKDLAKLQQDLDSGKLMLGFAITGTKLTAMIDLQQEQRTGRNVLARLPAQGKPSLDYVIVGAHVDHLGRGEGGSSLARDEERGAIHFGADDNASGISAMLEIAQYLADQRKNGGLAMKRDIVFAAWSGEELGLLGSSHFVEAEEASLEEQFGSDASKQDSGVSLLHRRIAACLNLDMVGRLREKVILQGVGSSAVWRKEIERRNAPVGLAIAIQEGGFIPTDGSVFYQRGVPMLSAFTGAHSEYHTPRDKPQTLNYDGAAKVAKLMALIARGLVMSEKPPAYAAAESGPERRRDTNRRVYLGTIPDYAGEGIEGVKISGVTKNGPAAKAGMKGGDVIVELAGKKIENIYDYTYALDAMKVGKPAKVVVERKGRRITLQIVPEPRD